MARTAKSKSTQPLMTTAQRLSSIVKACRDIMRKDKGLNGDLDRLPMLTWIMFLKFLDDMEQIRTEEAKMSGKRFRPGTPTPRPTSSISCRNNSPMISSRRRSASRRSCQTSNGRWGSRCREQFQAVGVAR